MQQSASESKSQRSNLCLPTDCKTMQYSVVLSLYWIYKDEFGLGSCLPKWCLLISHKSAEFITGTYSNAGFLSSFNPSQSSLSNGGDKPKQILIKGVEGNFREMEFLLRMNWGVKKHFAWKEEWVETSPHATVFSRTLLTTTLGFGEITFSNIYIFEWDGAPGLNFFASRDHQTRI